MDHLQGNAASAMRISGHMHRRILDHLVIQKSGISRSHHFILMFLADNKFNSQKDLAQMMAITPAAVTMALKKLEKDGYIERTVNPDDTRYNDVTLSEKGREIVENSIRLFKQIDRAIFSGFTEEELETFILLNQKIITNLNHLESDKTIDFRKEDAT